MNAPVVHTTASQWPDTVQRLVICIGAAKSATSFLFDQFEKDSRICVPTVKEVHFWDMGDPQVSYNPANQTYRRRALRALGSSVRRHGLAAAIGGRTARRAVGGALDFARLRVKPGGSHEAYQRFLLQDYEGEPVVFEATPNYAMCSASTFSEMAAFGPDTRLLFVLRDPVDRLWSSSRYHLRHKVRAGDADRSAVVDQFRAWRDDRSSLGFATSAYDRTLQNLDAAGVAGQVTCLFFETLSSPGEMALLDDTMGLEVSLDHSTQVNRNNVTFAPDQEDVEAAVEAFSATYGFIRDRFGDRVPEAWNA